MRLTRPLALLASSIVLAPVLVGCAGGMGSSGTSASPMTFFVTSAGSGKGADLGGLTGADQLCQTRAAAAGAGDHTWRAYLSTSANGMGAAVNARDRIGRGPWQNAKGVVIAQDVDSLHGTNNLNKETALTEKGAKVNGRGDQPNMHDVLTGSQPDGRAFSGDKDMTAATGPAAAPAPPWSATMTAPAWTRRRRRCPGTRRIRRAAAGRKRWSPPAAPAYCTASRPSKAAHDKAAFAAALS